MARVGQVAFGVFLGLAGSLGAGVGDWTEAKVDAEIRKHVREVHHVEVEVESGGAAFLLRSPIGVEPAAFDLVFHAKIETAGGFRGDAGMTFLAGGGAASTEVRGSVLLPLAVPMPASAAAATALFDRVFGEGSRGGVYADRTLVRGDDGAWVLHGEFVSEEAAFSVKAFGSIAPDDDDPSLLVLALFSEVRSGR